MYYLLYNIIPVLCIGEWTLKRKNCSSNIPIYTIYFRGEINFFIIFGSDILTALIVGLWNCERYICKNAVSQNNDHERVI